jgi:hypothetical protein
MSTELGTVDTFINADIDEVVRFLMDLRQVRRYAFGKEQEIEVDYLSRTKMRVYNPLVKSETICENSLVRNDEVAVIQHSSVVTETGIGWKVFLMCTDFGEQTHVLFGWYNTPEIKELMCETHGWEEFDPEFVEKEVALEELMIIKDLLENGEGSGSSADCEVAAGIT